PEAKRRTHATTRIGHCQRAINSRHTSGKAMKYAQMRSLVLSQPHGAVFMKRANTKMAAAGMTKATAGNDPDVRIALKIVHTLGLVPVVGASTFGTGSEAIAGSDAEAPSDMAGCPSFHSLQPITPTTAIIAGKVRPKL